MDSILLSELLKRSELRTLDFKLEAYDFSGATHEDNHRKRAEFAKDIVCMANTPRDEPAYIVIGVKRKLDGMNELKGVQVHVDDNTLQQKLDGLLYPHPRFQYEQVELNGQQFGVIEILPDRTIGPILPQCDTVGPGNMRRNVLYWRRGTQNAEASPDEQKAIHDWFRGTASALPNRIDGDGDWGQFVRVADVSEPGRQYVLVLAPGQFANEEALKHLAWVDWNLVVDFDPDSESKGVLKRCRDALELRRPIHRISRGDDVFGNSSRATFWYFCRGISGRTDTISLGSYAEWNKAYGKDLERKIEKLAAASSDPVVLVALWTSPQMESFVRRLLESSSALFGGRLTSVIVTEAKEQCLKVADETGATVCQIGTRHFLEGLSTLQALRRAGTDNVVRLPGCDGVIKEVSSSDLAWFEEDLEIIHLGAGLSLPNGVNAERDFLRGSPITWFGLGFGADVEREKLPAILNCVRRDLENRRIHRINLSHRPGAGGSTLARRVVWNLRKDFPCVVLKRCVARETIERLASIYALCEKPLLILREGGVISDNDADELAQLLGARRMPSVLLQVVRRYSEEVEAERRFFISDKLTTAEAERFRAKMAAVAPGRTQDLQRLAASAGAERTPFIFGLTAFARDFIGLRPFVQSHLAAVPPPQKKILLFLALAHAYGQQEIAEQHFAEVLGISASRRVELRQALKNGPSLSLLSETEKGLWRTAHNLVAREILTLILGEGLGDERNWNTRLADLACEFADFCRTNQPVHPEDLQTVVERVFFFRNDSELLGSVRAGENLFSELIGAIPNPEGRLRVFQRIVELFPDCPHYWAHLGRYYSIRLHEFAKAIQAIDRAIALNGKDFVLHHMKGMALRNLAFKSIETERPLIELLPIAKQASECFAQARALEPDEDYGYISEAQMITRLLDYAQGIGGQSAVAVAANANSDPWIREAFQKVEDLLLAVRQHHVGEQASEYEEKCRADLDNLYGAHDQALQRWQNLLDRRDVRGQCVVHAPPIRRQIVWTHLARCGRRWDKMPSNSLQRTLDLLDQNLQEEPADDRNVRLWIQGARFLPNPPTVEVAAERVAYWRSNGDSLDAIYYIFVLHSVQAIAGSTLSGDRAMRALEECKNRARSRRDRTRSFEWLGTGQGLRQLVHQDMLGEWDREKDFWTNTSQLRRLEGVVSRIRGPQAGEIALAGGLKAFFVPGAAGLAFGRAQNLRVKFFLGFSYEGLRAWSVLTA
jgi:tetratricopeptide (TPR) repeat protein